MAAHRFVGLCILAWSCLAESVEAQPVPYTYAYPYGWGGWKPSDEWVRPDVNGNPFYLGWHWSGRVHTAAPFFSYREPYPVTPPPPISPGYLPPIFGGPPCPIPPALPNLAPSEQLPPAQELPAWQRSSIQPR